MLFAVAPLVASTVHASTGVRYTSPDTTYDDTTTGALPHPEVVFAVGSPPMQLAQQLAKAHWGTDPCGGQVNVVWTSLAADINAQSSWTNPRSAYDNADLNNDCTVDFNPTASFDWPKFCTVTIHEFGHLSGKAHSPDPNDIMAAYYNKPAPECLANTPDQFKPQPAPAQQSEPASAASIKKPVVKRAAKKHRAPRARRASV